MPISGGERNKDLWGAGQIVAIYILISTSWILLSDRILQALVPEATIEQLTWLQTAKGLLFVVATSVMLGGLVLRRLRIIRSAEIERSAVEGRLATFADNLPGVAYIKDREGRFLFIRGTMPQGTRPPQSLVGRTARDVLDEKTFQEIAAHDREVTETGQVTQRVEPVPLKDGQTLYYLINRFPLHGPRGERWLGAVALDITERQNAEDRIRELARELETAGRLKDQFLSNLSHELRTPITAIRLWVDVLQNAGPDDLETVHEAGKMISDSAAAQTRLIEDLLDITRILAGKLKIDVKPTALDEEVRRTAEMLSLMAEERGVSIILMPPPVRAGVLGDGKRLQQVIWNLLSNAIKFSNTGGQVRVSLQRDQQEWVLQVSDDGMGIAPDLLPHLFERFRQGDSSRTRAEGGVGIGLSIVKYMVEAQGGSVAAASDGEGKGATFTVRLPALETSLQETLRSESSPAAPVPSAAHPLAGCRVLLVEDNADSRTGMTLLLRRAGATVQAVESVEQALELKGPFDVLLSDIGLPDRDGCDLIAELRKRPEWQRVPALAVSAYAMPEDRERAIRAGFDDFVVKPVAPDALLQLTAEAVRKPREPQAARA